MADDQYFQGFRGGYWRAAADDESSWFWGVNTPKKRPNAKPVAWWVCENGAWWTPSTGWLLTDVGLARIDQDSASLTDLYRIMGLHWLTIRPRHHNAVWNPCTWGFTVAVKLTPAPGPAAPTPPEPSPVERRRQERDARLAEVWDLFHDGTITDVLRDERIRSILQQYSDLN